MNVGAISLEMSPKENIVTFGCDSGLKYVIKYGISHAKIGYGFWGTLKDMS